MPTKKQIQPGEKVPLKLTVTERKLILEDLMCLDQDHEQIVRETPTGKPVLMTLDDLEDFGDYIAAEANHCDDKKKEKKLDTVFEKVQRLLESKPPVWRRIQVQDCTLDKLHEQIQTAMGWTNSHLHQFDIKGEQYGDPELLDDGFEDSECIDSTLTMLSEILPKTGERFAFKYEYDFGDGWEHEVLYEGSPPLEKGKKYPLCLEGERGCPPEDVGGVWGYAEYLEALADPKHERHEEFMDWNGPFDPDDFDPKKATREMKKGLPDWRKM